MKRFLLFPALVFVLSCASETENLAINEIAQFYECNVTFTKGVSSSTETGSRKTFSIKLSGGEVLGQLDPEMIASNSALILYDNLKETEKEKYTHINCEVIQKVDNSTKTTEMIFPVEDLKLVSNKKVILKECSDLLSTDNYEGLTALMTEDLQNSIDREAIFSILDTTNIESGRVVDVIVTGFTFFETEINGKDHELLQINAMFDREKRSVNGYVVVPRDVNDNRLFGFNF